MNVAIFLSTLQRRCAIVFNADAKILLTTFERAISKDHKNVKT